MTAAAQFGDLGALALDIAREAGVLIRSRRETGVQVAATKTSATDIVTEADRASEELVRSRILAARPDDGILGEEDAETQGSSGVRWIVDPIDGTVNYFYGLPNYAVSIAVAVDDDVVAGAVVNPVTGDEFCAVRGAGALRNGVPLQVRVPVPLPRMLVSTGFSYEPEVRRHQAGAVARLLPEVADIRRFGSCALDLCAVAAGHADGYVEEGVRPWDHAAAGLVATEAGARVELLTGASGRTLVVAAPDGGFDAFRALVERCGFAAEGPRRV